MSDPRTYVVGLPVVITVHDDGTVVYEIDRSEAGQGVSEYGEMPLYDEEGNEIVISEAQLAADYERVNADTDAYYAALAAKAEKDPS
jgi:hypothetical protein